MRKIKIFPASHVEVRVHVSDRMIEDYRECYRNANVENGEMKDCETCSWWGIDIGSMGVCEFPEIKRLLKEDQNEQINTKK